MKAWFFLFLICASCAYRQGDPERVIPGGYRVVRVPLFKNLSQEVGVEISFTNAMIDQLNQARVAQVSSEADVDILGTIESIQYVQSAKNSFAEFNDEKMVLAAEYRISLVIDLTVKKRNDDRVLWTSKFSSERTFSAAQVKAPIVNSVNPLYNLSARRRNIAEMAQDLVAEATDKMTENF